MVGARKALEAGGESHVAADLKVVGFWAAGGGGAQGLEAGGELRAGLYRSFCKCRFGELLSSWWWGCAKPWRQGVRSFRHF